MIIYIYTTIIRKVGFSLILIFLVRIELRWYNLFKCWRIFTHPI